MAFRRSLVKNKFLYSIGSCVYTKSRKGCGKFVGIHKLEKVEGC